jgi:ketosteroid isomerase-like protein
MNRGRTTLGGTDRVIRATLAALLSALDPDAEYELRHEDFVADMPQSCERVHGREAMRELQRTFPPEVKPTFTVRRIIGSGDLWTVEAEGIYGGQIFHVVAILELGGGKILRQTRYYAEPFEAPQRRAHLVERAGEAAT